MRHWAENYVGIPYSDFDCAELCEKIMSDRFGKIISLPKDRPKTLKETSKMIVDLTDDFACEIKNKNDIEEGDAVLMMGKGRINHIGIACFINNQTYVIHAMRSAKMTVLHNINSLKSVGIKLVGYYKWK